ncbi:MAG TPA: tetratricopeptide repeat protein [Blastocatellia bacterium]|nr:tetratricopeptide repeat protein [Blastocatellia bacterium]
MTKYLKHDYDGALADQTRAIELNPREAGIRADRGLTLQARGDLNGALADFSRSLEIRPDAETYTFRALVRRERKSGCRPSQITIRRLRSIRATLMRTAVAGWCGCDRATKPPPPAISNSALRSIRT